MKDRLLTYIFENYPLDKDGTRLVTNIIEWVWLQAMDKEDTTGCLLCMLDGTGITKEEIQQFIDW